MVDTIRAFIAVEIEQEIQSVLGETIRKLQKESPKNVKWVPEKNIHLTLKFLGDAETWELSTLQQMLRNIANHSRSFQANFTRLGAFPSLGNPRVIWVGLSAPQDLLDLARKVEEGARKIGFGAEEKPFTPHLTLGRVRPGITLEEQAMVANSLRSLPFPQIKALAVQSITLFQSILKPGGAEYIPLSTCGFNQQETKHDKIAPK